MLLALVCFLVNAFSNNCKVTLGVFLVGAIALACGWVFAQNSFAGLLPDVLGRFSLLAAFNSFSVDHVFDVRGILLYLSLIALLVFLTVQVVQKRRWN